ncbi:MAG TPA: uracil-DNA glycosylase [Nitrospiria bacterium]|jgi:DNA polymerase|nr:uracil-DNA glycosylase [Nitrospiria bacterium]
MTALQQFYEEIRDCRKCRLCESRTHVVFGEGSPNAEVMFVGEAPGENEDLQNRPFVGAAGKLLTDLLGGIGLKREDVYIANVIKCRPPENRNPLTDEIDACLPYLWKQIELIKPRVVCTLGNFAAQALLDKKVAITKVRGQHFQVKNFLVFPILHPAAVLHQGNLRPALSEDFQNLKKFLAKGVQPAPQPEQMGFF